MLRRLLERCTWVSVVVGFMTVGVKAIEIPEEIDPRTSLQTEVHMFLFNELPRTLAQGLNELTRAKRALKCGTKGVEDDGGGLELRADWQIRDRVRPVLHNAPDPFRPSPKSGMRQIRVQVSDETLEPFEYFFDIGHATWLPSLDDASLGTRRIDDALGEREAAEDVLVRRSQRAPEMGREEAWYRVNDLVRTGDGERMAPKAMSPESGNYILMSLRRHRLEPSPVKD